MRKVEPITGRQLVEFDGHLLRFLEEHGVDRQRFQETFIERFDAIANNVTLLLNKCPKCGRDLIRGTAIGYGHREEFLACRDPRCGEYYQVLKRIDLEDLKKSSLAKRSACLVMGHSMEEFEPLVSSSVLYACTRCGHEEKRWVYYG